MSGRVCATRGSKMHADARIANAKPRMPRFLIALVAALFATAALAQHLHLPFC